MSFPGLLRYYALFHVLVFVLQFVNPYIGKVLEFDRDKILSGELWRMVTFLVADSGFRGQGGFAILFLIFMVMIAFMMSDALEGAWGTFKTSFFYYTGFLGLLIANFIYETPMPGSGFFVYTSAFFAFATLFPKVEFLMFFILPVQVRWLAIVIGAVQLLALLSQPLYIGFLVLGFGNYLLWAGIPAMRGHAKVRENATRRKKFEGGLSKGTEAFHRCAVCKRTEISNPELEFRMAGDGEEYCLEHLD
ncbi:hypothetical protein ACFSSA_02680 [Luteolibacter algae]|uniref:Rhomboid family intramembrane serine protease n=1 Tax=Luteolibacter algae TaxID=454151 RepID=A0ABW5D6H8_9BACT